MKYDRLRGSLSVQGIAASPERKVVAMFPVAVSSYSRAVELE